VVGTLDSGYGFGLALYTKDRKLRKINSPGPELPENDRFRKKKGSGFPVAKPLAKPGFQPV